MYMQVEADFFLSVPGSSLILQRNSEADNNMTNVSLAHSTQLVKD